MKKWFLGLGVPLALLILFGLLLMLFEKELLNPGAYVVGGVNGVDGGGNLAVAQAAQAMAPYLRPGPPANYDVRYDERAAIMRQAVSYWSKLCPGCLAWQNGTLQCTMFVAAAFALAHQPLPATNLNAIDYWSAYRGRPGWMEVASGTGLPQVGDIVIWSSPFFGGVGHMGVVVKVLPPAGGGHPGALTFAEGNGPAALVTFPLRPDLQLVAWPRYTTMGYIRNLRYAFSGGSASQSLERISQLACKQYASQQECDTWAYSACSAAAMTEVIDAYGGHYRISDILRTEARIGAITPRLGLVYPAGVADTMASFGFQTSWGLSGYSLEQVVRVASGGSPVVVGFPPDRYAGGHILVVRGGQIEPASGLVSSVFVVDSSAWGRTSIGRAQFLAWWGGFYAISLPRSAATLDRRGGVYA
jgi:hypothetical protein